MLLEQGNKSRKEQNIVKVFCDLEYFPLKIEEVESGDQQVLDININLMDTLGDVASKIKQQDAFRYIDIFVHIDYEKDEKVYIDPENQPESYCSIKNKTLFDLGYTRYSSIRYSQRAVKVILNENL